MVRVGLQRVAMVPVDLVQGVLVVVEHDLGPLHRPAPKNSARCTPRGPRGQRYLFGGRPELHFEDVVVVVVFMADELWSK